MRTTSWMLLGAVVLPGCVGIIDKATIKRIVPYGMEVDDTHKVCALGSSLSHALGGMLKKEPNRALVIAEMTGGICFEEEARELELSADRAKHNFAALGEGRSSELLDRMLAAERAHALAARRFERSFQYMQTEYGELDGECPKLGKNDELVFVLGMVSGTLSLLHDQAGNGSEEIPLDRLGAIARSSECIDDEKWWHVGLALRAASWATIPGSAPDGVDPWALLTEAAEKGGAKGVRVAHAMNVLISANAGDDERTVEGIKAHAASLEETPGDPQWALLDEYSMMVTLHASDRLWIDAEGHRTETLGVLPSDADEVLTTPFENDPFGGDPFAEPAPEPTDPEAPADESKENE